MTAISIESINETETSVRLNIRTQPQIIAYRPGDTIQIIISPAAHRSIDTQIPIRIIAQIEAQDISIAEPILFADDIITLPYIIPDGINSISIPIRIINDITGEDIASISIPILI